MNESKTGGSAFPVVPPLDTDGRSASGYPDPEAGITVRDYFAAKAMQGMLCNGFVPVSHDFRQSCAAYVDGWAQIAYQMADAMLKERNK